MAMRLLPATLLALSLGALPSSARAEDDEPVVLGRTVVDGYLWNTSPVALKTGLITGGGVALRQSVGEGGLFVGGRLGFGETTENGREWTLQDLHGVVGASLGVAHQISGAQVWASASVGALVIRQFGERDQYQRLLAAGVPNLRRDGWSAGPYVSAEAGLGVVFVAPWMLLIKCGPAFTRQTVAGVGTSYWILESGLGVARAF